MNRLPIPCTVQILTRNSFPGVVRCLETLKDFAEVIVQDGRSTDGTREAAVRFTNVRILDQNPAFLDRNGRIVDFSSIRNESIRAARYDWVFVVDGDEWVGPDLIDEIRSIIAQNDPGVYCAFRRFVLEGEPVLFCCGYPAIQIRLFHRSLVEGYVKPVHERLDLKPGAPMRILSAELSIPLPPASTLAPKYERYLQMEVRRLGVVSWGRWFRWILLRHLRTAAGYTVRVISFRLTPKRGKRMPLRYEGQFIAHALRTTWATCPPVARRALELEQRAAHTS